MAPNPRCANINTSTLSGLARSIQISKSLSWLLRHGATKERIPITPDGYVKVSDVLAWVKLRAMHVTLEEVVEVVKTNEKQRFGLRLDGEEGDRDGEQEGDQGDDDGIVLSTIQNDADIDTPKPQSIPTPSPSSETSTPTPHTLALIHLRSPPIPPASSFSIRAVQGHSLPTIFAPSLLTRITPQTIPPTCVHGTFFRVWGDILRSRGLKAMGRNHVHFASGPARGEALGGELGNLKDVMSKNAVVSGMRGDAEVLIYVDVKRAMDAGMEWYLSENGVVLTEGVDPGQGNGKLVEEAPSELQETEMMLADVLAVGDRGGDGVGGDILRNVNGNAHEGKPHAQNGRRGGYGRRQSQQMRPAALRKGNTAPQKLVSMEYWDIVIGIGVGVLWERGKGVVREVPGEMMGRGKRGGRGGERGRGHSRNKSSVNPRPRVRVERDDIGLGDGFD